MDKKHIEDFAKIPQLPQEKWGFIDDIKSPLAYVFDDSRACDAKENSNCLSNGIDFVFDEKLSVPETALTSLDRVLEAKKIEKIPGSYKVVFELDASFEFEEYEVISGKESTRLRAADTEGARRAIYAFEDLLCAAKGKSVMPQHIRKKPFVKHRVSRCFFGPTYRPPFFIDELTNDVDYYPEEYLNKLAHENINGLWLTVYLRDYPTSIIPEHGKDAEKRYQKLRKVVEKCGRYGIKIYLFMSEPKLWGEPYFCVPEKHAQHHPKLIGFKRDPYGFFCTSSEAGKQYFRDTVGAIFANVPGLGGIINIMFGEDNGSCAASDQIFPGTPVNQSCPLCSQYDVADLYANLARLIKDTMNQYNPDAEYIGWFYAPGQRDGSPQSDRLRHIAEKFPADCTFMLNFESGVAIEQLGKKRRVFDYSLACVGPSKLFKDSCHLAKKSGAKLQVGCSHENAAVPFMPVPKNLYDKYAFMAQNNVSAAMQCWYFGNYPGLMNKAAGQLSFLPFPESASEFLEELARPDWRCDAPLVADAWNDFSEAYRLFPGNLAFEWYGPLHNSIAWPLHLFPVNEPIAPSWILKNFPEVSGDRIGESLGYCHSLSEALTLCCSMRDTWLKGLKKLLSIKQFYLDNPARTADIILAEAIGLQMKSTCNILEFYLLRQEMFYTKKDNLSRMAQIVRDEIENSSRMSDLCKKDCRLGYHSEAEGYHFFPEKLAARIKLLEELLEKDFPVFDINSEEIDLYTGRILSGPVAVCGETYQMQNNTSWKSRAQGSKLFFEISGVRGKGCTFFLEINRLHPPLKVVLSPDDNFNVGGACFTDAPDFNVQITNDGISFVIDLDNFKDFLVPGAPLRLNIFGDGFSFVEHSPWPPRLSYGNTNPNCAAFFSR